MAFPATVAPVKCSVLPLSNDPAFEPILQQISRNLTFLNLANKVFFYILFLFLFIKINDY